MGTSSCVETGGATRKEIREGFSCSRVMDNYRPAYKRGYHLMSFFRKHRLVFCYGTESPGTDRVERLFDFQARRWGSLFVSSFPRYILLFFHSIPGFQRCSCHTLQSNEETKRIPEFQRYTQKACFDEEFFPIASPSNRWLMSK